MYEKKSLTQRTVNNLNLEINPDVYLATIIENFLTARKSENLRPKTLEFYHRNLKKFEHYCDTQLIKSVNQITVNTIRSFIAWLEDIGHQPGGRHAHYRSVRVFLNWCELEEDVDDWVNPFSTRRLHAPRVDEKLLEPVNIEDVRAILDTCDRSFIGIRDRAIFYFLLDTGIRAGELRNLKIKDVSLMDRSVEIHLTKNHTPRIGFMCRETKKVLRFYLKLRTDNEPYLFVTTRDPGRITYDGLRAIVATRAIKAGVPNPTIHAFRRTFAITMLRKGVNVFQLQRLMGHSSLTVLMRYVKQMREDLKEAHQIGSPVEELLTKRF